MNKPVRRKFAVRDISKHFPEKGLQIEGLNKPTRESSEMLTTKIYAFENQLKEKVSKGKNENRCCRNFYYKIGFYVNKVMESLIFHILVLSLSVFSLFNNDIMTLALPIGVDKAFHKINELIFIFFLSELILFSFFKHNFLGSFYFYLDIIALISLLPEVDFIWIPLSYVLTGNKIDKNDPTMTTVISNLHLVKASRTSQLGSKASKYIKLLRLLNFLKIARLSKVIEESQKIKRENLNFLTNIFGKATPNTNTKLKKLMPVRQTNVATKTAEKPNQKLVRFNSKFWNKKKSLNISKRGVGESLEKFGQNNLNNPALIKGRFIKNANLDKTQNEKTPSNRDRYLNDISNETFKYDRIFNPKNFEGQTLNYEEVSGNSTINQDKGNAYELSPNQNRNFNLGSKISTRFRLLNQCENADIKEDKIHEPDNSNKNYIVNKSINNNSKKIINLNTIENSDSLTNTFQNIDDNSKTNFLKVKNDLSILNNRNSLKSQSNLLPEVNDDPDIPNKEIISGKRISKISGKELKMKINNNSVKTLRDVKVSALSKEKKIFQKSLFPVSKLSSTKFFLGNPVLESNKMLKNISNKNVKNNKNIRKSLRRNMSGKSIFPFISMLNKNIKESILKGNINSKSNLSNKDSELKKNNSNSSNINNHPDKIKLGYLRKLQISNSKIGISNKFSFSSNTNDKEKSSCIRYLLKNNFNQFNEDEIESILNRANSDDENSHTFLNPLQKELEIFLNELNISIKDLFDHKMEGLSDLENFEKDEIEDYEDFKLIQIAEEYNQNMRRFNIEEILNGKSEIIEKDEEGCEIDSLRNYSNFSSKDSSDVLSKNEESMIAEGKNSEIKSSTKKNNSNKFFKIEKIPEVVCLNKEDNKVSDFYGDLKLKEKKNSNKEKAFAKPYLNRQMSSFKSSEGENTPLENKHSTFKFRTLDSDVNKILKNEVDEINIIKKNINKIKKLNIQVEEINESPVNRADYPKMKNSTKTKKITKTEYFKEEKIYEIKNKSREDLRKSSVSPINKKFGRVNSNEKYKSNKKTPEFKTETKVGVKLEEQKIITVFNTDKNQNSSKNVKKESSIGLVFKNKSKKAFDSENLVLNVKEEKNSDEINKESNDINYKSKEDKKKIITSDKKYHHKRQTLEEIIMESLTQKVVILILLLLIMLPILGGEYVKSFLLNDDELEIKNYCMNSIDYLLAKSIENDSYLPNLKRHIESCETISVDASDSLDFNSTEPYFLYLNFSDFIPYQKILNKYNNTNNYKLIPDVAYDNLTERPNVNYLREGYDFMSDFYFDLSDPEVEDSLITFITNSHVFLIIDNTLSILKSIFVGVVLVWGAFLVSNDVNVLLIFPLDRIKTKMNYLINNSDEMFIKKEKLLEQEKNMTLFSKNKTQDKSLQDKSLGKTEMKMLDNSIGSIINLVNMNIGQNVLKIISRVKPDQNLKINLNQEGIKFNSCYMFFKMINLDNFVKIHKEKAVIILNKILYVIHSIATIHLGEINNQRNLIIWKEDLHEVYSEKIRYLLNIVENPQNNVDNEINKIKEDYDLPTFFKKDMIIQLAFLTANKIIASLSNNLFETFNLFLQSGATLNFVIDYGEIKSGLSGSEYKLDEILIGKNLTFFNNISNKINYKLPSIVISHEVYENISNRLRENFFISDIILKKIKSNGSFVREIIYRQYIDFSSKKYLEDNIIESLKKKDIDIFLKKQKINEEASAFLKILTENSNDFENFLVKDTEYKLNTNFINNNMINAINGIFFDILNKKIENGQKKIKGVLKNIKEYNEIFDYNISYTLKNLDQKLKEYLSLKKGVFYTIDLTKNLK